MEGIGPVTRAASLLTALPLASAALLKDVWLQQGLLWEDMALRLQTPMAVLPAGWFLPEWRGGGQLKAAAG